MDKKELLKRWALAYTEPSLFYVPWGKRQNPYGEYITVQFETLECTFEDWQRDPVFAVYKADDTEYENPVYCTALYDNDNNLVRNGIIQRRFFYVCDEYGSASTRVILPSGKYKIKMLCSGGGMITNGIEEWEFDVERGTSGNPIYSDYDDFEYSYRTVTIDPFRGYKYLQIDCEAELVKIYKGQDALSKQSIQSFDVQGYSGISLEKFGDHAGETYYDSYIPMQISVLGEFIEDNRQLYLMKAIVNEKIVNNHIGKIESISQRGEKKIIKNNEYNEYYHTQLNPNLFVQFTDYATVEYISYNGDDYGDTEYSFVLNYGDTMNNSDATYQYDLHADCYHYETLRKSVHFNLPKKNTLIGNPELNSVYTTIIKSGNNKSLIFNYEWKSKMVTKPFSTSTWPSEMPNIYDKYFTPERYNAYKANEQQYRENIKNEMTEWYQNENNFSIKNNNKSYFGIKLSCFLSNEMPEGGDTVDLYRYYVELKNGTLYHKNEIIGTQTIPPWYKIVDLGVNWSGYDNYKDENKWSGTILYNSELEVYHPELIPKEKAGET